jgi:putative membrane protein
MTRTTLTAGSLLVLLTQASPALADPERYYGPHMWGGGWLHMFFGFLMMILLLGIIVALVVLGVRWLGASEHSPFRHAPRPGERSALDILKERLARGEIEVTEFEERRRALGE